jgi:hypothetical protein
MNRLPIAALGYRLWQLLGQRAFAPFHRCHCRKGQYGGLAEPYQSRCRMYAHDDPAGANIGHSKARSRVQLHPDQRRCTPFNIYGLYHVRAFITNFATPSYSLTLMSHSIF